MSKVIFFSDCHFFSSQCAGYRTLCGNLSSKKLFENPPDVIVLLGDIFDFWVGSHRLFVDEYRELIGILSKFSRKKTRILYFEGNHDLYLKPFWEDQMGFEVYRDPQTFVFDGLRFRMEHGDLLDPSDRVYIFWKKFLQTSAMQMIAQGLPSLSVQWIGQRLSQASRNRRTDHQGISLARYRELVKIRLQKSDNCDFFLAGHFHCLDYWKNPTPQVKAALNLGSFWDGPKWVEWNGEDFAFKFLDQI